jgi:hypothetical protein
MMGIAGSLTQAPRPMCEMPRTRTTTGGRIDGRDRYPVIFQGSQAIATYPNTGMDPRRTRSPQGMS